MRPLDLLRFFFFCSALKSILYVVALFPNWGKCTSRSFGALRRGTRGDSKFGIKLLTMNLINFESLLLITASIKCEHLLLESLKYSLIQNKLRQLRTMVFSLLDGLKSLDFICQTCFSLLTYCMSALFLSRTTVSVILCSYFSTSACSECISSSHSVKR